ncbi:MAG: beta-N-acetylhexosaminidase [Beutenbergiaceae bacterium]
MRADTGVELIPAPRTVRMTGGKLHLRDDLGVLADRELRGAWPLLTDILATRLGLQLYPGRDHGAVLRLQFDPDHAADGYQLDITAIAGAARIQIVSGGLAGALSGLRTLQQLLGQRAFRATPISGAVLELPMLRIADAPRFGHRGVLLDVARHFLPKDQVMRFIDIASMHKINVLHLHLTDDQGWRFQVRAYPRLTEIGGWRRESQLGSSRSTLFDGEPHGGYYTQDDLREIVEFARTRGVRVVPEIDVPGHSQAAMAAYPELAAGSERLEVWTRWGLNQHVLDTSEHVVAFYCTVLDELVEIFDSETICLGGDEVATQEWLDNPSTRAQAHALGLDEVDELLPWFIGRLAERLRGHGRRVSVWDEVGGARVPADVIINSWRGYRGGLDALREGRDIVVCNEHELFLNHRAAPGLDEPAPVGTVQSVEDVYQFEPVNIEVEEATTESAAGSVLGAQAQVWREQLPDARRTDFATYPRLCALAEVFWSPRERRDWQDFSARLSTHVRRLEACGVDFRPLDGPRPWHQRPNIPGWPQRFDDLGTLVSAPYGER